MRDDPQRAEELFPLYGGPRDGAQQPNSATIYVDRVSGSTRIDDFENAYRYHLVEHGGRRAFVPVDDRDLVAAFHKANSDPESAKATMLAAELQRRGVNIR